MGMRLVRDRIGEVPWALEEGKRFLRPVSSDYEHVTLLKAKLLEEAGELITATDGRGSVPEELADVLSVLEAIAATHRIRMDEVMAIKSTKDAERGGFLRGMVLTL